MLKINNKNSRENYHIELGFINTLKIDRIAEPGYYLTSQDQEEVLLPNSYINDEMELDSLIDVFVYTDSEDRLVATTLSPKAYKNEFFLAKVVDTTKFGAFVDWGLPKDLFVPLNQQKRPFKIGQNRIIKIVQDNQTNRLIGTEKFTKYLKKTTNLKINEEVDLFILAKTPLGYKVIVNNNYEGLIYHNEIFCNINIGDKLKGYIKKITKDGKLDISLSIIGKDKALEKDSQTILKLLQSNNGILDFNTKSDAKDIQNMFGISKKAFKRAVNSLIKNKQIIINDTLIKKV